MVTPSKTSYGKTLRSEERGIELHQKIGFSSDEGQFFISRAITCFLGVGDSPWLVGEH